MRRPQGVNDLAVLGGAPAFDELLHVGRPNIGEKEALLARIEDMLERRWLSNNGPYVQEFEKRLCEYTGAKHCMAVCNATIGLEIAIRATGMKGEVIVPSFTFVATAHSLQWQEITPVFCDVDCRRHHIDPEEIERLITPRTTGIIGVHLWGQACDVDAIDALGRKHNLTVLYDAAHAFGTSYKGRMVGNFGAAEVFSFHATKFLNTFEGGAVVTNDDDLARRMRLMKNFGFEGYDNVTHIGTNGKMTEVCAAMGITGLESVDRFIETNRANYLSYREALAGIPGVTLMAYDEREKTNYQYVVLDVDERAAGIGRDHLLKTLHGENVIARRYFYPGVHRMEPYRSYFPHAGMLLPVTEEVSRRVLVLPTGTAVGAEEIGTIAAVIRLAVENAGAVTAALAGGE